MYVVAICSLEGKRAAASGACHTEVAGRIDGVRLAWLAFDMVYMVDMVDMADIV